MSVSDWHRFLDDRGELGDLYDSLPALDLCDLFYVHFDERDISATLGFTTSVPPSNMPSEWIEKEFNTTEFYLFCSNMTETRVSGWGSVQAKQVKLAADDRGVRVTIGTPGAGIDFRASALSVTKTRAYKATSSL
ncbi:immunity 50 family protein [Strepomyces sp. STD 3.1]|nr:immunity 50 family protein [Streptomyces sp. STD 3.1]